LTAVNQSNLQLSSLNYAKASQKLWY